MHTLYFIQVYLSDFCTLSSDQRLQTRGPWTSIWQTRQHTKRVVKLYVQQCIQILQAIVIYLITNLNIIILFYSFIFDIKMYFFDDLKFTNKNGHIVFFTVYLEREVQLTLSSAYLSCCIWQTVQLRSIKIIFATKRRMDVTMPPVAAGSKYDTYEAGLSGPCEDWLHYL